jgi:hypothetical protein
MVVLKARENSELLTNKNLFTYLPAQLLPPYFCSRIIVLPA